MAFRKRRSPATSPAVEAVASMGSEMDEEMEFIDLRDWVSPKAEEYAEAPELMVRSAEISRPEDVAVVLKLLYQGELLLLDFQPLANDSAGFKASLEELQKAVKDLDGDLVGLGRNYLIAGPKGSRIARHKLRYTASQALAPDEELTRLH